jgi:hypothetical protein
MLPVVGIIGVGADANVLVELWGVEALYIGGLFNTQQADIRQRDRL